jgi:RNA polymerase sigma factor (TIGR02999 family)
VTHDPGRRRDDSARGAPVDITRLLQDWQRGDREALDQLVPLVYEELHVIAARHLSSSRRDAMLQTTALVNEAYLKLVDQNRVDWQNRAHFFAIAARLMRRIVIDDARRRLRDKRGGGAVLVALEDDHAPPIATPEAPVDAVDLLGLDRALTELEAIDADQGRIVELRFYGGLTVEETAAALGLSPATIKREWAMARSWLFRALTEGSAQSFG